MKELANRIAIVTGGNRGIGRATAVKLAEQGATVIIVGRNPWLNREAADSIIAFGGRAETANLDVTDEMGARKLIEQTANTYGRIDILVNNAGICQWRTSIEELPDSSWDMTFDVNIKGILHFVRPLIPIFKAQRYGKIINISSMAAQMGSTFTTADYAASKAAVLNLTMTLARSLAPYGINANAVAPGFIRTEMTAGVEVNPKAIPLGYAGEPEDIAEAILFLASDRSRYITGTTLDVNGGWNMRL